MSRFWINTRPEDPEYPLYAAQCLSTGGYIPWSPYAGRHVVDNFGELVQALPNNFHKTSATHTADFKEYTRDYNRADEERT